MFKIEDDIPTFFDVPLVFTPRDELPKLHVSGLRRMKQAGPVSRTINALWPWDRTILVGDPNLLKEILVGKNWTKFERGGNPYAEPHGPYSNGIISLANNQRWRDTRAMFERTFTTVNVRRYTPILLDLRDVLLQELEKANNANPAGFDLFVRFHAFTFDVITRLTFGSEIKAQTTEAGAKYSHKFDRWLACSNIMSLVYSLFGKWAYALIPKIVEEWSDAGRTFFGLIQTEKERIERGDHRASIMDDAYAIAMSEKMPASMTDESLQKALMSVLFAGHDTTAVLLSFLAYVGCCGVCSPNGIR